MFYFKKMSLCNLMTRNFLQPFWRWSNGAECENTLPTLVGLRPAAG